MKTTRTSLVIMLTLMGGLACTSERNSPAKSLEAPVKVTAGEISRLPLEKRVTFSAILGRRKHECVEVFVPEAYHKYHGDGKWALPAKFMFDAPEVAEGTSAVVTGKMIFFRDSDDLNSTCGILTGQLFEIEELEL